MSPTAPRVGNFGLVWVKRKGLGAPHYQRWTRCSTKEWPGLAELSRRPERLGMEAVVAVANLQYCRNKECC